MSTIDKLAWIHTHGGCVLSTRSRGRDRWYLPGGKREPGESDAAALAREIREELSVDLRPDTLRFLGRFEAPAHGHAEGVTVVMTCYAALFDGTLAAASEIEEVAWLSYADRDRVSAVDQIIFDWLRERGELR